MHLTINNKNKTQNQTLGKKKHPLFPFIKHKRPKEKPFLADLLCSLPHVLFLLCNNVQTCPLRFLPIRRNYCLEKAIDWNFSGRRGRISVRLLTHHGLREGYHHKPPLHPLSDYRNRYW